MTVLENLTVMESLLVGVIGISVVFLVLVGLSLLLRLQSALVGRFTRKKPAGPVGEVPEVAVAEEVVAADVSSKPLNENISPVQTGAENQAASGAPPVSRPGTGVRYAGSGKYIVTVDDIAYEVEMEAEEAPANQTEEAPRSMPVKTEAQTPVPTTPAPKPVPTPKPAQPVKTASGPAGGKEIVTAPVPGTVLEIKTAAGAAVKRGDVLILLEAMKMENEIVAPKDGTVTQVLTSKGASVEAGTPLAEIQ